MAPKPGALAELAASRLALANTAREFKSRISPPQIAEDVMSCLDPDLSLLGRIRSGIEGNRLLSLAVLAGAAWLVGAPRRNTDKPRTSPQPDPVSSRSTIKENNNDSGKISRNEWRRSRGATAEEPRAETGRTQGRGKAEAGGSRPPLGGDSRAARHEERREGQSEA